MRRGLVSWAVHILACLQEPKFEHFQAVIDAYIRDHFAAALVYKGEQRKVCAPPLWGGGVRYHLKVQSHEIFDFLLESVKLNLYGTFCRTSYLKKAKYDIFTQGRIFSYRIFC
jgi:hypothetical protein